MLSQFVFILKIKIKGAGHGGWTGAAAVELGWIGLGWVGLGGDRCAALAMALVERRPPTRAQERTPVGSEPTRACSLAPLAR